MSTRPATRAETQVQTRERLIDAAARVFARRGYHVATLDEVAREAGYSTGAVYSNFSGKEDLFLALADRQIGARAEQARAVAEAAAQADASGAPDGLQRAIASWFRAFVEDNAEWPLLFYEFWSYGVRSPHLRAEFEERRRAAREAIARPLAEAAAARGLKLRYPPEQVAAALSSVINGLAFERTVDPEALSEAVAAFVVSTVLEESLVDEKGA
jgi:AcrR family transcriptional regulator